jgi:hypothetical protein
MSAEGCHWKRAKALQRVQKAREALAAEGLSIARGDLLTADWPARVDVMHAEYLAASDALASLSDCSE